MIKSLVVFGLTRRAIVVMGVLVFCAAGLAAFLKLNIEAYPNPAPVILEITAQAPGLSSEEMEKYYTIPMEIALYPTPGVDTIRSTSFYGLSFVRVTFKYGFDYFPSYTMAAINLQQNVNLPGNQVPQIQQSSLVGEIFRYQVVGPEHFGLTNLRTIQDWVVTRRLLTVPGVVQINSWGGTTKQFNVDADTSKLEAYNVTIPQMITALGNSNINVGGREITLGQQSVNIRGIGLINSGGDDDITKGYKVNDIENVVLSQANGVPVRIKDVATVSIGYVPRLGIAGRDKEDDVVAAIVVMNRIEHTNNVLPLVEKEIHKINTDGTLPPGVKVVPYYDRGSLVDVTTHTVLHNLVFGCLLVFFIQWIFLGDLRSALIVSANIPFALFFAIIILVLRGEDANLLSLGAVDFGIIVDSAVILVENIFRIFQGSTAQTNQVLGHLSEGYWGADPTSVAGTKGISQMWTKRLRLILISVLQVDKAIFFTATITVTAFVPLFTMQGVEGQIFGPMARTYGYALAGALFATFTITPVLASLMMPKHIEEVETFVVRGIRAVYEPLLRASLRNLSITIVIGIAFLVFCGFMATRLGSEFLPALEEGNYWIRASMPPTIGLDAGTKAAGKMREILQRHHEIITVVSQHGRPDNGSDASPFSNVELFAPLRPLDQWTPGLTKDVLTEQLQKEFTNELPGISFNFSQYIQDNVEESLSGVKGANSVKIVGPNLEILEGLAVKVQDLMAKVPGVADLGIFRVEGQPNLNIKIDREKTARYGLNTGDVNSVIQAALGSGVATTVLEGDRQFAVAVRLKREDRNTVEAIRNVKVAYTNGSGTNSYVPLSELASIKIETGASYIYREQSARYIPIKFSVRGRDLGSTVGESQAVIAKNIVLPTGYRILWAGEFEDLQKAKDRLAVVVPLTFLLILLLLYSLFNSLRDSLLAMAGIPFSVGGGILALNFFGLDFSVSAAIGFISLLGVAVMDGILNLTYYRELRIGGMPVKEAVEHGSEQRMRPMLMTVLSAGLGLFPAAISHGIGSQVQRPLAAVVVGGMTIGPIMLLFVAPALRMIFLRSDENPKPARHEDDEDHTTGEGAHS